METERQIRELEKAMTTTDNRRLYERCLAGKLVLEGHTRKEAGHTIGRNFPPPAPLPENTKHREYFPGCFPPFTGITYYRVRAHRTPRIALLYFVMLCLLCIHYFFPLFSPVDYETDAAAGAPTDYAVDDPSLLPEQSGKPPP